MKRILERCALDFKQIRYCKGLEYLCLGVVLSYPEINTVKYTQLFYHFMREVDMWELYLEGSPRYYSELNKIDSSLEQENGQFYSEIQKRDGNLKHLFVTYYRSCLLYRLENPELIRKLFELLFVGTHLSS
jgi:hypothetical protein